jgi:undecaprenyl-diphosphatase
MFDTLVQFDKDLFLFFNGLHNSFFDQLMWWFSGKLFWIPLYLAVLAYWIKKYKINVIWVVVFAVLVVLANDQISVAIKVALERPRPSHNPEFEGLIHHVNNYKGGAFGFVSSHAANTFGFAMFSLMFIRKRWYTIAILSWAAVVSYSRVYLGVHYPGDITFGGLLGVFIGLLLYWASNYGLNRWPIKK